MFCPTALLVGVQSNMDREKSRSVARNTLYAQPCKHFQSCYLQPRPSHLRLFGQTQNDSWGRSQRMSQSQHSNEIYIQYSSIRKSKKGLGQLNGNEIKGK